MKLSTGFARSRSTLVRGIAVVAMILLASAVVICVPKKRSLIRRNSPSVQIVAQGNEMHQVWNELLHRYVDTEGNVDYPKWRDSKDDLQRLDSYLASFSRSNPDKYTNKSEQLAFWINAYNAVTIRGILRKYPTSNESNTNASDSGNEKRDEQLSIGDSTYTLDDIEHSILRKFAEPRIHFAINCGARGCTRLLDEAYDAERLEDQLEQNARGFFADRNKFSVDKQRGELRLSPILNWYASDFGASTPDVLRRIAPWLPNGTGSIGESGNFRVIYNEYDWTLNDQTQSTESPLPPPDVPPPDMNHK